MLIFDQLKKDDPQLRLLAMVVLGGMGVLLAGLWWVQVVSSRFYQDKLETQSLRTIRIPAVRGAILDRDGRPLAENRPSYNLDLYLEDLSRNFQTNYAAALSATRKSFARQMAQQQAALNRKLTPQEKKRFAINETIKGELQSWTRFEVASNIVADLGARLQMNIPLEAKDFEKRYDKARALPLPVMANLDPVLVARFEEQSMHTPGVDLDIQSERYYPNGTMAAHLLGYLVHNNESGEGEQADYNYRLVDFRGEAGIEKLWDKELRGTPGGKSVLVNNLGYRQGETVWSPTEPGDNVFLTIDRDIQKAAESALQQSMGNVRGAVVVMDAGNGDILAMASAPTYNPNDFVQHPEPAVWDKEMARFSDDDLKVQLNRAMQENYAPGSIFKIVVGLAGLEQGTLNPREIFHSEGSIMVGRRLIGDTAGPGDFDFNRALARSSNPYFITQGLKPGVLQRIVMLGQRLHLGERTGVLPRQETKGEFPDQNDISPSLWRDGDTANLSIGQGAISVTPLQMAVMTAAIANGGKVFWPRLVSRLERYDASEPLQTYPQGNVRDTLPVSPRSLRLVHDAMVEDVETPEGTGHAAAVPGWHMAGKTGTAEVEHNGHKEKSYKETWFVSFAPAESPRYVVVATVEGGASGGLTCAPIAHKIYLAIQQRETERNHRAAPKLEAVAAMQ